MDKEKLIAAMRKAVDSTRQNGFIAIRTVIEACAEAALKELGNEWVRVDSGVLPEHGKAVVLYTDIEIMFDGFYSESMKDFIVRGEVFNKETQLGHYITHWMLPSPPKQ